jgi:hypothetical protein
MQVLPIIPPQAAHIQHKQGSLFVPSKVSSAHLGQYSHLHGIDACPLNVFEPQISQYSHTHLSSIRLHTEQATQSHCTISIPLKLSFPHSSQKRHLHSLTKPAVPSAVRQPQIPHHSHLQSAVFLPHSQQQSQSAESVAPHSVQDSSATVIPPSAPSAPR